MLCCHMPKLPFSLWDEALFIACHIFKEFLQRNLKPYHMRYEKVKNPISGISKCGGVLFIART